MGSDPPRNRSDRSAESGEGEQRGGGSFQLVRNSHIFSAAVRDVLESGALQAATDLPLTLSQVRLITLLSLDGRHKIGEIADYLGVSAPAATKRVDKLEKLGLLSRSRGEGDRRSTIVELSPDGRALAVRYERRKTQFAMDALRSLDAQEMRQLALLLDRLSLSLLRQSGPDRGPCLRCGADIQPDCGVRRLRGGCPYAAFAAGRAPQARSDRRPSADRDS